MKAHTLETQSTISPSKALEFLKEGNQRFISNLKINRNLLEQVNDTREGQWPFATILSCIDSRTSAELLFDQGLGDIFSIRIAGNFVNTDILGSMEFACRVAGSKLLVVLGHSHCGALKGCLDYKSIEKLGTENLESLVQRFEPYIEQVLETNEIRSSKNLELLERLNHQNILETLREIRRKSPTLRDMESKGEILILGANYCVETGVVSWLEEKDRKNTAHQLSEQVEN